jgi:hypothetical protein
MKGLRRWFSLKSRKTTGNDRILAAARALINECKKQGKKVNGINEPVPVYINIFGHSNGSLVVYTVHNTLASGYLDPGKKESPVTG